MITILCMIYIQIIIKYLTICKYIVYLIIRVHNTLKVLPLQLQKWVKFWPNCAVVFAVGVAMRYAKGVARVAVGYAAKGVAIVEEAAVSVQEGVANVPPKRVPANASHVVLIVVNLEIRNE